MPYRAASRWHERCRRHIRGERIFAVNELSRENYRASAHAGRALAVDVPGRGAT
jgi:hypothetical protein